MPANDSHPSASPDPRVAIVTPSFNQARFLRETIESVLGQSYPHIDYLVVDGGSTDGSLEVLRSFGERVRWISEPDRGQADAIAKGFARTNGEILAWINSDDILLTRAVEEAVTAFRSRPDAGLVYANGLLLDEQGRVTGRFPWVEPPDLWRLVYLSDYVLQPSAFFRRSTYDEVGGLDVDLHYAMDWDLWIRLAGHADMVFLPEQTFGCSRIWGDTKTSTGGWRRIKELAGLARKHTGTSWTPGVKRYAIDALGSEIQRRVPRVLYRLAGRAGARVDQAIMRQLPAHADGWLAPRGHLLFPRRWGRARLELDLPWLPPRRSTLIDLRVDGALISSRRVSSPGPLTLEVSAPPHGKSPFVDVEIRSSLAWREHGTRRRLTVRVIRIAQAA
ncbi:MAG: glycosyltransferase family 2 protein [Candidatus Binatia bacterium]